MTDEPANAMYWSAERGNYIHHRLDDTAPRLLTPAGEADALVASWQRQYAEMKQRAVTAEEALERAQADGLAWSQQWSQARAELSRLREHTTILPEDWRQRLIEDIWEDADQAGEAVDPEYWQPHPQRRAGYLAAVERVAEIITEFEPGDTHQSAALPRPAVIGGGDPGEQGSGSVQLPADWREQIRHAYQRRVVAGVELRFSDVFDAIESWRSRSAGDTLAARSCEPTTVGASARTSNDEGGDVGLSARPWTEGGWEDLAITARQFASTFWNGAEADHLGSLAQALRDKIDTTLRRGADH